MTFSGEKGRLERILIVAALLAFLVFSAIHLFAIPLHVSMNYNEGWNAYFAQVAMGHGGVLYPAAESMLTNNYPPLSFYIVGVAGWLIGDNIVAGRLISLLALAVVSLNVYRLGRWLGAPPRLALLGACVFLLGAYAVMHDYIAINDPQFLAYAFVTSGALAFLNTSGQRLWRGMLLSTLLMMLGGLVKHSEISLPLALCTWAVFYDRRRLGVFLACALLMAAVASGLAYSIWGEPMVAGIFHGHRLMKVHSGVLQISHDLPFLLSYLILAGFAAAVTRLRHQAFLVLIYISWSLLIGFWMLTGYGVNQNVMCDAVIALAWASILFAMTFERSQAPVFMLGWCAPSLAILLMVLPSMGCGLFVYLSHPRLRDMSVITNAPQWERLYQTLSLAHGEVACETLAVCYWAKKPMEVDFFNYGQKLLTGAVRPDAPNGLRDKLDRRSYEYVVIDMALLPRDRLPPFLMETLFRNYKPSQSVAGTDLVLVRK